MDGVSTGDWVKVAGTMRYEIKGRNFSPVITGITATATEAPSNTILY